MNRTKDIITMNFILCAHLDGGWIAPGGYRILSREQAVAFADKVSYAIGVYETRKAVARYNGGQA